MFCKLAMVFLKFFYYIVVFNHLFKFVDLFCTDIPILWLNYFTFLLKIINIVCIKFSLILRYRQVRLRGKVIYYIKNSYLINNYYIDFIIENRLLFRYQVRLGQIIFHKWKIQNIILILTQILFFHNKFQVTHSNAFKENGAKITTFL